MLNTVLTVLHILAAFVLPETPENNNNFIPIFSHVASKVQEA